jgi:type I restriction enzyme S subunit
MSEWKEVTLQDVVTKLGDGLHGTPKYDENGKYYFINGNNLRNGKIIVDERTKKTSVEEYNKYKKDLNDRTILVSINGTLGNIALYNNERCFLGKSACYFNVKYNVDKLFIKYVITNRYFQKYIDIFAHGTTIKNVSLKTMREYPFALPPLPEQKAIAAVLSSLDDKIDMLQRQNQTLESLAQTLFRQWFIENADNGWEEGVIGDYCNVVDCLHAKKPNEIEGYKDAKFLLQVYNIAEGGRLDLSKKYYVSDDDYDEWIRRIELSEGDLIISKTGRVGAIAQIPEMKTGIGRNLVAIRAKDDFTPEYLKDLMLSNWMKRKIRLNTSDGTILQSLHVKSISALPAIYPGKKLIEKYSEMILPIHRKIWANVKQSELLEKLRDTLLPKLMSGEVKVRI